jgi:hypothetical protein
MLVSGEFMCLSAVASMVRSRRFWVWQLGGAVIYGVPVFVRLATGNVLLPVLSWFEVPWIDHYVPGNLVEKVLVNAFFPGGAGAVAGEVFFGNLHAGVAVSRRRKYLWRLAGALLWTAAWSLFQFWGNMQNIMGSYGGNLFEYPMVFPLNFLLASLSIFTPDIIGFVGGKTVNVYQRLKRAALKLIFCDHLSVDMPFHVRRKDREITDPTELRSVLKATKYVTVALCMHDEPYLVR